MPRGRFDRDRQSTTDNVALSRGSSLNGVSLMRVSKRALLAGGAALGVGSNQPATWSLDAQSIAVCQRWLALDDERESLLTEWSRVEASLMRDPKWRALSESAKAAHSGSQRLAEIDQQLEHLYEEGEVVLALLPSTPANKIDTVIAYLSVAERLLPAEENDQVHGMIARAVRDLKALTARL